MPSTIKILDYVAIAFLVFIGAAWLFNYPVNASAREAIAPLALIYLCLRIM
jgi:hypothetical protein